MERIRLVSVRHPRSPLRSVAAAVLAPAAATGLALAIPGRNSTAAASLYFLGVVAAAVYGGLAAGIVAAVASSLGLNYFFTEPVHTFRVIREEDIVALPDWNAILGNN